MSEETRRKISEAGIRRWAPFKKIKVAKQRPKHITEKHKRKISNANKGKVLSELTKQKISLSNTGKVRSDETKERLKQSHKGMAGKVHNTDTLSKMALAAKSRPHIKCVYCSAEGNVSSMKRWHLDNCKQRPSC